MAAWWQHGGASGVASAGDPQEQQQVLAEAGWVAAATGHGIGVAALCGDFAVDIKAEASGQARGMPVEVNRQGKVRRAARTGAW